MDESETQSASGQEITKAELSTVVKTLGAKMVDLETCSNLIGEKRRSFACRGLSAAGSPIVRASYRAMKHKCNKGMTHKRLPLSLCLPITDGITGFLPMDSGFPIN